MKLGILAAVITLAAFAGFWVSRAQATDPTVVLEVFKSRSTWKDLNPVYREALARKFSTADQAIRFVRLCEESEILKNNMRQFSERAATDPDFAIIETAITLTSYGNSQGTARQFDTAIEAFEFAILLNKKHVPAYLGLSTAHRENKNFVKALHALDSAPPVYTYDSDTMDFHFDIAFQRAAVFLARLQVQDTPSDRTALIMALKEARTHGQRPLSQALIDASAALGYDARAERREKLEMINGLLSELQN